MTLAFTFKYEPRYCQEIQDFMEQGYSATAFAGAIGVHRSTLYDWEKAEPEFALAFELARSKRQRFWEKLLITCASTGVGNSIATIFALKNCGPSDFSDRIQYVPPGDGGANTLLADDITLARAVAFLLRSGEQAGRPRPAPRVIEGEVHEHQPDRLNTP